MFFLMLGYSSWAYCDVSFIFYWSGWFPAPWWGQSIYIQHRRWGMSQKAIEIVCVCISFAKTHKSHLKKKKLIAVHYSPHTHRPLYEVHLFNCLVTQIANQPITWQQLNAFRHLDVVKTTCWSSNRLLHVITSIQFMITTTFVRHLHCHPRR